MGLPLACCCANRSSSAGKLLGPVACFASPCCMGGCLLSIAATATAAAYDPLCRSAKAVHSAVSGSTDTSPFRAHTLLSCSMPDSLSASVVLALCRCSSTMPNICPLLGTGLPMLPPLLPKVC